MADIGSALYSLIQTKAAITALVSTRVFPTILPQRDPDGTALTYPAMTYTVISQQQSHDLSGMSGHGDYLVQFDYYHETSRTSVVGLADTVRVSLQNHSGAAGSETVQSMFMQQQIDLFQNPVAGSPQTRFRITQDWRIHLVESTS